MPEKRKSKYVDASVDPWWSHLWKYKKVNHPILYLQNMQIREQCWNKTWFNLTNLLGSQFKFDVEKNPIL